MKKTLFFLLNLLPALSFAQPAFITSLYPPQHGLNIPADAEIHIGFQKTIEPASICDLAIYIYSDITGLHKWDYFLDNNGGGLYLYPKHWWGVGDVPFNAGERVTVTLTTRLCYADGSQFEGFTWHYTIAVRQNYGGNFTPQATFGAVQLSRFYVADFNGDRAPDLAAHDSFQDQLAIFLNDRKGKFEFAFFAPGWGAGGSTQSLDYDYNGGIDVACGMRIIKFNDGNANFTSKEILPSWVEGYRLYDFNNDGIFDVVANVPNGKHGIKIALSANDIAFADTQQIFVPFQPFYGYPINLYDLDSDGQIDVVAPGQSLPDRNFAGFATIKMKDHTPLEVFQQENNSFYTKISYANDLNDDGCIDYAFIGGYLNPFKPYPITHFNNGTGYLIPAGLYSDTTKAYDGGAGGDIDGDGDIDFFLKSTFLYSAMPELVSNKYTIAINRGDGIFDIQADKSLPYDSTFYGYGSQTKLADLDLDGDLDVMLHGPGLFMVFTNEDYGTSTKYYHPSLFELAKLNIVNFPNPFNSCTMIQISGYHKFKNTDLLIFDVKGRLIRKLKFELNTGVVTLKWDGLDDNGQQVSSGLYLLQVKTDKTFISAKILLLK